MSFALGPKIASSFSSYPYLNVARQTGAAYGTVLKIADAFDWCNFYVASAKRELEPKYGNVLVEAVLASWLREQERRRVVLKG